MYCLQIYGEEAKYNFDKGSSILDIIRNSGNGIEAPCGGNGTCGKCKVKIVEGMVSNISEEERKHLNNEDLKCGLRLACLARPLSNVIVELLYEKESTTNILTDGYIPKFEIKPSISKKAYKLSKPTLENNRSYEDILEELFENDRYSNDPEILRVLPEVFRHDEVTVIYRNDKAIGVETGDTTKENYGIAIDIGTTTVVVSLIDVNKGREIGCETAINPQKEYGLDVLSRIDFVKTKNNGLDKLRSVIVNCINDLIMKLCKKYGISQSKIYESTIAANATMMHILLGVNTDSIGKSPYTTVFSKSKDFKASSIGLEISPFGRIYCLPGVSSYIGADIVAGVLVGRLDESDNNVLFIDIGTNGEIILSKKGKLFSCSCAAGPALEGMNISCGMRASDGAIEGIDIKENKLNLKIIGNKQPLGLCGSGILEAVSEALRVDMINKSGRIKGKEQVVEELQYLLAKEGKKRRILINKENNIYITQGDIRQVQLAKGAILSGIYVLLDLMKIDIKSLDEVIIAGQFGRHLTVESLTGVGIIPRELSDKIKYIGNSSKTGAIMCLLSREIRDKVENVAHKIDYFELSTKSDYEKVFTRALSFPK